MALIKTPDDPGLVALLAAYPLTGQALGNFAEHVLREGQALTDFEREIIFSFASFNNGCVFCHLLHAAAAWELLPGDMEDIPFEAFVRYIRHGYNSEVFSPRLHALLKLTYWVLHPEGKSHLEAAANAARRTGATDADIHQTVLVVSLARFFNTYVDGLQTEYSDDPLDYIMMGRMLAHYGYAGGAGGEEDRDSPRRPG